MINIYGYDHQWKSDCVKIKVGYILLQNRYRELLTAT